MIFREAKLCDFFDLIFGSSPVLHYSEQVPAANKKLLCFHTFKKNIKFVCIAFFVN